MQLPDRLKLTLQDVSKKLPGRLFIARQSQI